MKTIRVILVRPQGPINVGMIARLCANLGAQLRLVQPQCDVNSPEARMFANHAQPLLASAPIYESLIEATADCQLSFATSARPRRSHMPLLQPEEIMTVAQERSAKEIALVFGSEQDGLSQEEIDHCDIIVQLQTPGDYHSYNLSQAVAIVLYIATTSRAAAPEQSKEPSADAAMREKLLQVWQEALTNHGYFRRSTSEQFAPKLRALLSRLSLREHDLRLLMNMMAHLSGAPNDDKAGNGAEPDSSQ